MEEKKFRLSDEGKKVLIEILAKKPYSEVYTVVNTISSKSIFTETEGNRIINFIGNYPYKDVIGFFSNIENYFPEYIENENDDEIDTDDKIGVGELKSLDEDSSNSPNK